MNVLQEMEVNVESGFKVNAALRFLMEEWRRKEQAEVVRWAEDRAETTTKAKEGRKRKEWSRQAWQRTAWWREKSRKECYQPAVTK